MLKWGFPRILHSDNGAKFKSKLMENLSQQLGIRKTFISPYQPQANGKLKSLHRFTKDYVLKYSIGGVLEWDQLLPYATAAFNWFANEHSHESPHLLYFGHDPYLSHLAALLQPTLWYLDLNKDIIHLDKLRQAYMLAALNMRGAWSKQPKHKYDNVPIYHIDDLVMITNFDTKSNWDAKYIPNFRVVHVIGSPQLEVSDPMGRTRKINVCNAHKIMPSDHIISSTLDRQVCSQKGKYINDPRIIKEVVIIDAILREEFHQVMVR